MSCWARRAGEGRASTDGRHGGAADARIRRGERGSRRWSRSAPARASPLPNLGIQLDPAGIPLLSVPDRRHCAAFNPSSPRRWRSSVWRTGGVRVSGALAGARSSCRSAPATCLNLGSERRDPARRGSGRCAAGSPDAGRRGLPAAGARRCRDHRCCSCSSPAQRIDADRCGRHASADWSCRAWRRGWCWRALVDEQTGPGIARRVGGGGGASRAQRGSGRTRSGCRPRSWPRSTVHARLHSVLAIRAAPRPTAARGSRGVARVHHRARGRALRSAHRYDVYRLLAEGRLDGFDRAAPTDAWPAWQRLDGDSPVTIAADRGLGRPGRSQLVSISAARQPASEPRRSTPDQRGRFDPELCRPRCAARRGPTARRGSRAWREPRSIGCS